MSTLILYLRAGRLPAGRYGRAAPSECNPIGLRRVDNACGSDDLGNTTLYAARVRVEYWDSTDTKRRWMTNSVETEAEIGHLPPN